MIKYFTIVTFENPTDHFPEHFSLVEHANLRSAEKAFDNLVISYDLEPSEEPFGLGVIARAFGNLETTDGDYIKCTVELLEK